MEIFSGMVIEKCLKSLQGTVYKESSIDDLVKLISLSWHEWRSGVRFRHLVLMPDMAVHVVVMFCNKKIAAASTMLHTLTCHCSIATACYCCLHLAHWLLTPTMFGASCDCHFKETFQGSTTLADFVKGVTTKNWAGKYSGYPRNKVGDVLTWKCGRCHVGFV